MVEVEGMSWFQKIHVKEIIIIKKSTHKIVVKGQARWELQAVVVCSQRVTVPSGYKG